ncbi:hypothetical protein LPB72_22680 [Hydrogenophaga crassostreae]|uniref:Uncharacterized protein n=1 Tax=Hydrogenophaga crassostreae TaxID=1763535 RepID=A0A167GFK2_9BURK|nr:hypothetical protein [Hydrogenophaga crassostreae]AOW11548.1 hypothetical protein LPB072_00405 [Hydrogenophaga crassostreae]OAD39387.1 hypothetical protein LPB72_22680 [Hydrogenophaga crassostreae]
MRKIAWLAILAGAFYAHSYFMFSERNIAHWLNQHDEAVMRGKDRACDDYTYDLKVHIRAGHATGEWQVDGGKDMMCEYEKRAGAALMLANARINTEREIVSVERSGFPWMTATVKLHETHQVQMGRLPRMEEIADATITFERKIRTMSVSRLESVSEGNFLR